jgi:sugar phosphate isomerase/epimerase
MKTLGVGDMWTRRGFVGAVVTAAAGAAMPASSAAAEPAGMPRIRLGVASYSFHKFERAKGIGFLKELNCRLVNCKDVLDHLPMTPNSATTAAVEAYRAAGITVTGGGVVYFPTADEADVRGKFDYARRAGLGLMVVSPTQDSLPVVERFVKEYGIRVAIHNHGPEDKEWPSPMDVLGVIARPGAEMDARVGLCVDVGHCARTGTDVVAAIHAGGARVFDVHMKDLADMRVKESQVTVGDGKMPVRGIFEALTAIGYQGCVDLEYEIHEDDPLPGMVKSFAYMRGVLAGMEYAEG